MSGGPSLMYASFGSGEEAVRIRLLLVEKYTQHDSECPVHELCLAIDLWVIGCQ